MINLLNKLPIPNLRHYCLFSFSLLSLVALYAYKVHYELRNVIEESAVSETRQTTAEQEDRLSDALMSLNATIVTTANLIATTYRIIVSEPWCVWVLINFSYCCLILFSKIIQMVVFGKLRAVENQVETFVSLFSHSLRKTSCFIDIIFKIDIRRYSLKI